MLARLLSIPPGYGRTVLRLGGHFLVILAATTFHGAAAEGLFIASYPASRLPLAYLGGSLLGALSAFAWDRLRNRVPSVVLVVALALLLVAMRVVLSVSPAYGPFLFFLAAPAFGILLGIENAHLVSGALDPREARKLLPAIGALGGLGPVAGGVLVGVLSPRLGAASMAWPAAALVLLSILFLERRRPRARASPKRARGGSVFRHRFALLLVALVFLAGLLATLTRFQLGAALKAGLPPERIASYLGLLGAALSAAAIVFQLTVARVLIGRLGVGSAMAVYPTLLATAGTGLVLVPGLATATAAIGFERLLRQNLLRPILLVAVMPLPEPVRSRTTTAVRGALEPLAVGTASVGILAAGAWPGLVWLIPTLAAAAVAVALAARRLYAREVTSALHARRLRLPEGADEAVEMEAGVRRLLHEQIRSELPVRVALALKLLEGRCDGETVERIRSSWARWDPWLRVEAVRALSRDPVPAAVEFLRQLRREERPSVRAAVLRSGVVDPDEAALGDPDLDVRREALARLGPEAARPTLEAWARSDDAALRGAAAYVLGVSGDPALRGTLEKLVDDAPAEVARAIARRPEASSAATAVRCLPHDGAYAHARDALVAMGSGARPALLAAVRQPETSSPAIRVLGEMRDPSLLDLVMDSDPEIRYRAAKALLVHGVEEAGLARVRESLEAEIAGLRQGLPADDHEWAIERIFVLLSVVYPDRPFRRIFLSWASHDSRQKAFALEALEESLPTEWKRKLLPLLEGAVEHAAADVAETTLAKRADRLKRTPLFSGWRRRDLELVAAADPDGPGPRIRFEGDECDVEEAILGRSGSPPGDGALAVPLEAVYRAIALRPRAGPAWLRGLARRGARPAEEPLQVTRTHASLGSRTAAEAPTEEDIDVWHRIFFLRAVPLFSGLSHERLRLLAEIARPISAAQDEVIVREGKPGNHFYLVCSGFVEVGSGGRQLAVLGEGEGFGELALLTGDLRSATVRAMRRSDLLSIDRTDFLDLIEAHPSLVPAFSTMIASRARGKS